MNKPQAVLMDLDGTVYAGSSFIPGASEVIQLIRSNGVRLYFFTNNSEKTRKEIADKLVNMGVPCIEEDIVSSGYIAVDLVKERNLEGVFVSGSDSFRKEFIDAGINLSDEYNCKTLIIGMDSKYDFQKMTMAVNAAIHADRIIACNVERIFPVENGTVRPGCGAMVASVEYCSRKTTDMIVGKPERYMMDYVCKLENITPDMVLVIGDTFESDTMMAIKCGAHNILIGTNDKAEFCIAETKGITKILETNFNFKRQ